jgi:hypothetical protein
MHFQLHNMHFCKHFCGSADTTFNFYDGLDPDPNLTFKLSQFNDFTKLDYSKTSYAFLSISNEICMQITTNWHAL